MPLPSHRTRRAIHAALSALSLSPTGPAYPIALEAWRAGADAEGAALTAAVKLAVG